MRLRLCWAPGYAFDGGQPKTAEFGHVLWEQVYRAVQHPRLQLASTRVLEPTTVSKLDYQATLARAAMEREALRWPLLRRLKRLLRPTNIAMSSSSVTDHAS